MRYYNIRYKYIRSYGDWVLKCVIYTGFYKVEDYYYNVIGYNKGKEKIYIHINTKCANYEGAHTTNSSYCRSKHKTDLQTRQNKKDRDKKEKNQIENISEAENRRTKQSLKTKRSKKSPLVDIDLDLRSKD